jgi:ABC-type nitrate/sulfonate/bicarbonate transport system substrate-binding protein
MNEAWRESAAWTRRTAIAAIAMLAAVGIGPRPAWALDLVPVGKTASNALAFTPLEIGTAAGIWQKHGIEIKVLQYAGDGKMQQGLIANEIEFGLGSGPSMGFIAKDVPAKTVGVIANEPLSMGLIVKQDSPIKSTADLKGRKIGITTNGSLTYWLARALARREGWSPDAIRTVPMGTISGQIAGLKSGQVDGFIMSASVGYMLEDRHEGKVLLHFGDEIKDFHTHVIFATNKVIGDNPDLVRRFLAGWQETVDYMFAHRTEAIELAHKTTDLPLKIQEEEFDKVMPMMSRDLRFNDKALDVLLDSFIELGILDTKPDPKTLYTEAFLPPKK